jgi:hypothetical protein
MDYPDFSLAGQVALVTEPARASATTLRSPSPPVVPGSWSRPVSASDCTP